MCPVIEILLNTPLISDYIRKGEVHLIKDLMAKSTEHWYANPRSVSG